MTIVVEGPDGAGKTRLILRLQERLSCQVAPRVVAKDTTSEINLQGWVEKDTAEWPKRLIYDRHRLLSEPIYGPIIRGHLRDGFDTEKWFQRQLLKLVGPHGPIIIYCMPPLVEVLNNLDGDDDNKAVVAEGERIYWLYHAQRAFVDAGLNPSLTWDYTIHNDKFERLVAEIQRRAYIKWGNNVRYD